MTRLLLALSRLAHDLEDAKADHVSADWLREFDRKARRREHIGRAWKWPLNKLTLDNGRRNARVLRVGA